MQPSPELQERNKLARFLQPGDHVCGRRVFSVQVDEHKAVTIGYDDGSESHAHADDWIPCDLVAKDATWMRVEPTVENGVAVGWTLVLDLDSDWQRWSVQAESGRQEFRLDLSEDDLFALAKVTVMPIWTSFLWTQPENGR
jgi:hypothetical protein